MCLVPKKKIMNFSTLCSKICAIAPDREWLLYPAGLKDLYHLGEADCPGLHLMDATANQVLEYVQEIADQEGAK